MSRRRFFIRVRPDGEQGAVAVTVAILLIVVFTFVASVVDIAAMRADARAGQRTGDLASMAGALALDPVGGGSPYGACISAYRYFLANTYGIANPPSESSACAPFSAIFSCDAMTPETQAIVNAPPYRVTITLPVSDGSPLMQGRNDAAIDGSQCQRVAVQVRRTRGFLFGGIVNASQGQTEPPAVARATSGQSLPGLVALVLLDPTGCKALTASGQAKVFVMPHADKPGIITVDSSATERSSSVPVVRRCVQATQDYAIDAIGTQNSKIQAGGLTEFDCTVNNGLIFSYALMPGGNAAQSYENIDVNGCRLVPRPVGAHRVTRAPIDHRYDCKQSYPSYMGFPVAGCKAWQTTAPYITNLKASIGTSGVPSGYTSADSYFPGNCRTQQSDATIIVPPGNWYVSCPQLNLANTVIFQPPANIVFEGTVTVGSQFGQLCINVQACSDTSGVWDGFVYFRRGDVEQSVPVANFVKDAFGTVNLMRTMVYLDNGRIDLGAGSGGLTWIAPIAGFFEDLALWSERQTQHLLGGQALLNIEGTFFTPYADPFRFQGQAGQFQTKAQFVTFRMDVGGQGVLRMEPDPDRTTLIPIGGVILIR